MYDWYADIEDATQELSFNEAWDVAGAIMEEHPGEEYRGIMWRIPLDSKLYGLLGEWYDEIGLNMEESIRGYHVEGDYMYYITGAGYAMQSVDLLGGTEDGEAERQFEEFVRERC